MTPECQVDWPNHELHRCEMASTLEPGGVGSLVTTKVPKESALRAYPY